MLLKRFVTRFKCYLFFLHRVKLVYATVFATKSALPLLFFCKLSYSHRKDKDSTFATFQP